MLPTFSYLDTGTNHAVISCVYMIESSNPGSTHFWSRTEFQSTNGCGLSQSGLQSELGAGVKSGLNLGWKSCVNGAIVTIEYHTSQLTSWRSEQT